ncbi:DNA-binding protein RFX2 isoform X3 [Pygocentrus nattereri]|nr:DNA-binding protein RFX2 isoform X3 [Pygocentrus nattereri]XP_037391578.1 DNA-binding protein RFX2 isoform X3 [Pygocentrus nattereri]XP_037391579.1 DNA-binding protein RFX2 isoform X3 [Pygocentrus nattereri]
MQNPEGGSAALPSNRCGHTDVHFSPSTCRSASPSITTATAVAMRTSTSAQAPVVQPVPASQQRVSVQATGSSQKGVQVQQLSRVQQVPQQVQQVQHPYPSQVQYVEGGEAVYPNGTIRTAYSYYTEGQLYGQGSTYFDSQTGGTQVTTVVSSASGASPHSMVGITMDVGGSQIISSGSAYLIHGGMEGGRHLTSHSARSSSAALELAIENLHKSEGIASHKSSLLNRHLQWLLDNYEIADGVSLARCSLYHHYLRHCQEQKLDPVNAASFGKLIRSVFMGLRTRRLGTRGNSKYHYYGIRVKPDSPLSRLQDDSQYMAMRQQPVHQKQRFKPLQKVSMMGDGLSGGSQHSSGTPEQSVAAQSQHHQQFIDMSHALPPFPSLDLGSCPLPERITMNDVKKLQSIYRDHCEATLDVVMNLQFHLIEKLWQTFWYSTAPSSDSTTTIVPNSDEEIEGVIPSEKLIALCKFEPVKQWMRSCDHILYQALVEILIPDVLRPVPSTLTQAIRNFAKSLESWLTSAMSNFPQEIVRTKAAVVSAFAQTLRRYTSLNHLAQAARAVLQNTSQINQMLSDLNRVDFANVQEQASWVCQCDESVVQRLEQDFKVTLQQQSSLDQWAAWLDNVVSQVLKPHEGSPSFPRAARQFLLKWSFYSSMVIRDLTLRSAASFGSFHLIRLLYDEYMFYLVEHRVAQATGETPIAVMGEVCLKFSDLSSMMPPLLEKDASFSEDISDLGSDGDVSRGTCEPAIKSERIEINHSLQEI